MRTILAFGTVLLTACGGGTESSGNLGAPDGPDVKTVTKCIRGPMGPGLELDLEELENRGDASNIDASAAQQVLGGDSLELRAAFPFAPGKHVIAYKHCRDGACRIRAAILTKEGMRLEAGRKRDLGTAYAGAAVNEVIEAAGLADIDEDGEPELILVYTIYEKRVYDQRLAVLRLPMLQTQWETQLSATPVTGGPGEIEEESAADEFVCDWRVRVRDADCDDKPDMIVATKCMDAPCWAQYRWPTDGTDAESKATDAEADDAWASEADTCGVRDPERAVYVWDAATDTFVRPE